MLISKVLQNLSNDVMFGAKEPFMQPMNDFLSAYRAKMMALQEHLAEVPVQKLQELQQREPPSFDDEQLVLVHEVMYRERNELKSRLLQIEAKQGEDLVRAASSH